MDKPNQISRENLVHFSTCQDLKRLNTAATFGKYVLHLESLLDAFNDRFRDFVSYEQEFSLFVSPFSFAPENAADNVQLEHI